MSFYRDRDVLEYCQLCTFPKDSPPIHSQYVSFFYMLRNSVTVFYIDNIYYQCINFKNLKFSLKQLMKIMPKTIKSKCRLLIKHLFNKEKRYLL